MENRNNHLYSENSEVMQLSYDEYIALQEKMDEAARVGEVKESVLAQLQRMLIGDLSVDESLPYAPEIEEAMEPEPEPDTPQHVEVSEAHTSHHKEATDAVDETAVDETAVEAAADVREPAATARPDVLEVPPIKGEIADHFNRHDESGRLFSIFKQYYTCLNESCGGTVRVTMKDGFCSLWNYDEWEEFAYVDIHEGQLRIAVNPRYTDELKPLSLCEAPRLISSRHNVICVQVGDLNTTVLDVLTRAFSEVGMQIG
jgi:hypothetical protein